MNSLRVAWTIFAGLLLFIVWIQLWNPLVNDVLFPFLNCASVSIPNASLIQTIVSLGPLIVVLILLLGPIVQVSEPGY